MELIKNPKDGKYGLEGEVFFGLFNEYIDFAAEEYVGLDYVTRCAQYLNVLNETVIEDLCAASIRYCNEFLSEVGEEVKSFPHQRDVLSLIYPSVLIVPEPENGDEPVVHLELNCEWEEEHGMEWIVRGDKVLYVGAFNGQNPWGDYSTKDFWNYA